MANVGNIRQLENIVSKISAWRKAENVKESSIIEMKAIS
jgi:transcriptional regulator with AAA-type ATPase domain